MGLYKSKSGVPWSAGWEALLETDMTYYSDHLADDWMKDKRKVDWASKQEARTHTNAEGLISFVALAEWSELGKRLSEDLSRRGPMTTRSHARLHEHAYKTLSRSSFDDWVVLVEHHTAVLESSWQHPFDDGSRDSRDLAVESEPAPKRVLLSDDATIPSQDLAAVDAKASETLSQDYGVSADQMPPDVKSKIELLRTIVDLFSAGFSTESERWAAISGTLDIDPLVLRIHWLRKEDAGWDHASQAISGTPTEVMKSQARSFQHNFVHRWEDELSTLSRQDPLFEGFMRIAFDGWIVGYAEAGADWTIGAPCNIRTDLLADATADQLRKFDQTVMSDAAFFGLEQVRGITAYQQLFRPLGLSAVDVLSTTWGREGLEAGGMMLVWGYCLARAQRDLTASAQET